MNEHPQHETDDEQLSAYLDDELAPDERAAVEARLATDPAARQLLDDLQHVSKTLRHLPPASAAEGLRETILRRAEEAKRPAAPAEDSNTSPPTFTIGRTRRGWLWASLAIAAALFIMVTQEDVVRNDDGGMKVAQRRHEPASLSAVPEASPSERRAASTRELAESDAITLRPAGETVGGMRPELSEDRLEPREPATQADDDELLVVHVTAKREALENRAFEKLLVSNGIAVESGPAIDDGSFTAGTRIRSLGQSAAQPERSGFGAAGASHEGEENVDVVLVEAPTTAIMSCLSDMNQDYSNYLSLSVDDKSTPAASASALKAAISSKLKVDLNKYSRGIVPQQQKDLFARNKSRYYQAPREQALAFGAASSEAAGGAGGEAKDLPPLAAENFSNRGRAQRFQLSKAEPQQLDDLRRLSNQQKSPGPSPNENLQVLFVLTPGDDAAASPAAENRAE
jgi:hypothetical protein